MEELHQKRNSLDIGEVVNDAFEIYKKTYIQAGLAILCIYFVLVLLFFIGSKFFFKMEDLPEIMKNFNPEKFSSTGKLIYIACSAVFLSLIAPFMAGIFKMFQDSDNNEEIAFSAIFAYINSPKYIHIVSATAIIAVLSNGFNLFLKDFFPEFVGILLGAIISLAIGILTYIVIPLVIFKNLNCIAAIKESTKQIGTHLFPAVILMVIAFVFSFIGIFAFCIGIFFTIPFLYAMQYSVYKRLN
ncbi:hypothetical protein [Flavobacterium humi]|uniref:DUF2189 domain-containing protein n=1 Tax=Flavobacterium humi TaxID=2562683 RepID=A0A4Z0LDA7_9FLAO|nr:hypothetical protein [Flavobacterium humi]TGD59833.1 hypothetical protein E4635_02570 [Flavobacterium humi]